MDDELRKRLAALSPEKRALLEKQLASGGLSRRPADISLTQRGLWFLDQLVPGSPLYTLAWRIRLTGKLDVPALRTALNAVVARHEALRTRFAWLEGRPVQVVLPELALPLPVLDLSETPAAQRAETVERICREKIGDGFDVAQAPLIRTTLLRLGDDEHVLLLLVHHLVFDAVSFDVLLSEVVASYGTALRGDPPAAVSPPVQYREFAAWQQRHVRGETLRALLDHWKNQLAGAPTVLDLPTDHPRPAVQSFAGAEYRFRLSGRLRDRVNELARAEHVTPFMTLLAAFQLLLSRYSGQDEICVGSPVSGRTRREVSGVIGLFVNTVVLRGDLRGNPTFRQFLRRVRDACVVAFDHQELPFDRLVEELRPERSLSHNPLVQTLFLSHYEKEEEFDLSGVRVTDVEPLLGMGYSRFDVSMFTLADRAGIDLRIEYSVELFDASTIERMAAHFERLLTAVTDDPSLLVDGVDFRLPDEVRRPVTANDTARELPDTTLTELLAEQARRSPDALAVISAETRLSFAELHARADALAARLVAGGAGPEQVVAVALDRSVELVVALVAVLKSGAAYLPLDPAYPPDRTAAMIADARAVAVIAADAVPATTVPVVRPRAEAASGRVHPRRPVSDNPAYVIFTSGSTGRPKGVVVSHRAIVNRLLWAAAEIRLGPGDRVLQKTPATFDVSVWEFFLPLITGAAIVVADAGGHRDANYLAAALREHAVTVVHFVPSMLAVFLDAPAARHCSALRAVVCSGEALPGDLRMRCHELLAADLYNLYGPTEAAVDVTSWRCAREPNRAAPPIGRPVWNTGVYVLDSRGGPVPANVVGELYLAGVQLARGYANRPGLTAERFLPDPFGAPGTRMYRTGDLARLRADGVVEYVGRTDDQVKIRGQRVEPGEIETVLTAHPAVARAAVLAVDDRHGERTLVAYVVPRSGGNAHPEALRTWLARALPDFMVPAAFVMLETLPISANGKLDRRALLSEAGAKPASDGDAEYAAGATALERVIAVAWGDVLKLERVGAHDDFFRLGGHSLLAARAALLVGELLGTEVAVASLFRVPTPARFAAELSAEHADPAALERIATMAESALALSDAEVRARLGG